MKKYLFYILITVFIPVFISGCIVPSTGKTDVGVRTKKIALWGKKGVQETYYPPGRIYYLILPIINDWHTLDTKRQNLIMVFNPKTGDRKSRDDLLFKTIDGNDISLDVIISYKIDSKMAWKIIQDVAIDDNTYVYQTATDEYAIFVWKDKNDNNTDTIKVTYTGKSNIATSTQFIYLEIYNQNSSTWEQLDIDNTTIAGTEFTLTGNIVTNVSNYYDANYWIICRVYQHSGY